MSTDYQRAMSKTYRQDGCSLWTGALTSSGAPRLEVDGEDGRARQVDARRVILEYTEGRALPAYVRLENRCGRVCLNEAHIRVRGEDELMELRCACGQTVRVLKALYRGAWCEGPACAPHPVRPMTVNPDALCASVSAAYGSSIPPYRNATENV